MKNRIPLLAFFLSALLVLGAAVGCTEQPSSPDDGTTTQATQAPTTQEETTEQETPAVLTITEGENGADVTTPSGLCYTASGYESVKDAAFDMTDGLVLTFGDAFAGKFNRFTIKYIATAPMKITLTYTENDKVLEDVFYLDAGEKEFSAVNPKFMMKSTGKNVESMRVDTCQDTSAEFILLEMKTETIEVPAAQQFISGARYTLGIDLKWGGAINHVEDKECPIEGVTNICNKHDEGRLIQQSYYGVFYRESEYKEGGYLGVEGVAYNPVQGGDASKRDSRIIDFIIKEDYIYIKAQPLDWPLSNSLTPSYMENEYVVKDDYIQVFNRFTDYSGWTHPTLDQELPAVYTVNTLDTFVWYDGNKPWTGDELCHINDWSVVDPNTNKSSHYCVLSEPNTETWCALIDSETQYGLGIYVPNTDKILTMRYLSDQKGDTSDKGNPCSYMCPIDMIAIVSYKPIEYSYIMAAGNVEQIREVFSQNRDFCANEGLNVKRPSRTPYKEEITNVAIEFSTEESLGAIFYPRNTGYAFDSAEKALTLQATDADPNVTFVFDYGEQQIFAENLGMVEIVYMLPTTNAAESYETQLFLCSGSISAPVAEAAVTATLIADGQYHTLQIPLKDLSFWKGQIHMIRFDYFSVPTAGDTMFVKSFRLGN